MVASGAFEHSEVYDRFTSSTKLLGRHPPPSARHTPKEEHIKGHIYSPLPFSSLLNRASSSRRVPSSTTTISIGGTTTTYAKVEATSMPAVEGATPTCTLVTNAPAIQASPPSKRISLEPPIWKREISIVLPRMLL